MLCAGIFLHTADAASASGLFAPRGQALYFTSHTRIHHTVGSCVCLLVYTDTQHAQSDSGRDGFALLYALFLLFASVKVKSVKPGHPWHGGSLGLFASHSPPSSDSWSNNLSKNTSIDTSPPGEIHISSSFARMETPVLKII